jgi:hypothetical protein
VCMVRVDVADEGHMFADVADGETGFLASAGTGKAQIIWREGMLGYGYETGEQWAIVGIGGGSGGGGRCGKSKGGGVPGRSGSTYGSATVTLYRLAASGLATVAEDVTAYNQAEQDVEPNTEIQVKVVDGLYVIDWEECNQAESYE